MVNKILKDLGPIITTYHSFTLFITVFFPSLSISLSSSTSISFHIFVLLDLLLQLSIYSIYPTITTIVLSLLLLSSCLSPLLPPHFLGITTRSRFLMGIVKKFMVCTANVFDLLRLGLLTVGVILKLCRGCMVCLFFLNLWISISEIYL